MRHGPFRAPPGAGWARLVPLLGVVVQAPFEGRGRWRYQSVLRTTGRVPVAAARIRIFKIRANRSRFYRKRSAEHLSGRFSEISRQKSVVTGGIVFTGDGLKDLGQPELGNETAGLGHLDQSVEDSGGLTAALGTGEQPVFVAGGHGAHGPFSENVVDLQVAIAQVVGQDGPSGQSTADRLGQCRLARHLAEHHLQFAFQRGDLWRQPPAWRTSGGWPWTRVSTLRNRPIRTRMARAVGLA